LTLFKPPPGFTEPHAEPYRTVMLSNDTLQTHTHANIPLHEGLEEVLPTGFSKPLRGSTENLEEHLKL